MNNMMVVIEPPRARLSAELLVLSYRSPPCVGMLPPPSSSFGSETSCPFFLVIFGFVFVLEMRVVQQQGSNEILFILFIYLFIRVEMSSKVIYRPKS